MARTRGATETRRTRRSRAESRARRELAACYRMFYRRGMDDLIYTHLSVRLPDQRDRYLFIGFGQPLRRRDRIEPDDRRHRGPKRR